MDRTAEIAKEVSIIMPRIAKRIAFSYFQSKSIELPPAQVFALMALFDKGSCRLSDLSREMEISAPTTTGIIDRLEKSKYVHRVPDKTDRRAINIELTEKGIKFTKELRVTIKRRWQEILKKLPCSDREHYLRILTKIQKLI